MVIWHANAILTLSAALAAGHERLILLFYKHLSINHSMIPSCFAPKCLQSVEDAATPCTLDFVCASQMKSSELGAYRFHSFMFARPRLPPSCP